MKNKTIPFAPERKSFVPAKEIQRRLEAATKYSKRQVRAYAHDSSARCVDLVVSCPLVSIRKIEEFAKLFRTGESGQIVDVVTTKPVDDSDALRFAGEAFDIVMALTQPGQCRTASNGANVNCIGSDFVVSRDGADPRYGGDRESNLSTQCRPLALAIARA